MPTLRNLVTLEFYETYYYVNIVHNVLSDPFPYIRHVNAWHEDREAELLLPAFPRWSRLHDFTRHVVQYVIAEDICDTTIESFAAGRTKDVWVDEALKHHKLPCVGFKSWLGERSSSLNDLSEDDLANYHTHLYEEGPLHELVEHISKEVFYVLFANRTTMANLNSMLAGVVQITFDGPLSDELAEHFQKPGQLKRVSLPEWVKRAVFHRDRGMCAACNKDLSGLVSAQPDKHYDHIVPLALGGLNDVTNIQLLCENCNLDKSAKRASASKLYESWY